MLEPTDSGVQERWRALWDSSPQRSPFSRLEYVQAAADAAGLRVGVHLSPSAGAAVTWRRRGPYREVIMPPFTPFSALLLETSLSDAEVHARSTPMEALLEEIEGAYHVVRLHLSPSITDIRPAQWRGWTAEPLYTYSVFDSAPKEWSTSAARNFRTARDDFDLIEGPAAADDAIGLVAESYGRRDRALPLSRGALAALAERLMAAGLAASFAVRRKGSAEPAAGIIIVRGEQCAYYWIAGSLPGDGMTVLIGELLPRLFRSGIESFDFVGANTPTIAEFKRRFGAELVPYFRIVRYMRRDLKLLYSFRKMLR